MDRRDEWQGGALTAMTYWLELDCPEEFPPLWSLKVPLGPIREIPGKWRGTKGTGPTLNTPEMFNSDIIAPCLLRTCEDDVLLLECDVPY